MKSVQFQSVSKSYGIYDAPGDRLGELLSLNRWKRHRDFWALRDVSFEVQRGETFCILGENGSGKSTLLQIVAGILQPTEGAVEVSGRVAALLELGAGFNPEFTGRDNLYLNGAILGLTTRQIDQKYRDIEDFAEIGRFLNQPVRTYSSGMVVRLAFAIAVHVDPEILLVDEALAVGDLGFRQRCMRKVHELRARGVTILFVSHSLADVKAVGDRVLWLDHGRMAGLGSPEQVVGDYLAAMTAKDSRYLLRHAHSGEAALGPVASSPETVENLPNIDRRYGDGRAVVLGIVVLNQQGYPLHWLEPGSRILIRISVRAHDHLPNPIVGFMLRNQLGIDFWGTDTAREDCTLSPLRPGDILTVDFHTDLPELYPAAFSFSPAISDGSLHDFTVCDWIDNAIVLQMERSQGEVYGYIHIPCRVDVNSRLGAPRGQAAPLVEHPRA
ncbi:MAG: ABC transporter ATP-binding protein [Acidobacteriia bacterium]|nr:ABC transporter ATP-binding protein [Terriglobia bacterium]